MRLEELRERIDAVDSEIRELLLERFALARGVAEAKIESGSNVIFRAEREDEILSRLADGISDEEALLVREIYKKIMVNSRTIQYRILADGGMAKMPNIAVLDEENFAPESLICQGIEGAYSHLAAMRIGGARIEFRDTFREVFSKISGQNYGILPLDNSTEGMVSAVYDLLAEHDFYIVQSIDLEVNHVAMAKCGVRLEDVRFVTAHPQALSQCSHYIERMGWTPISATNNAVAARDVAYGDRRDIAVLGDESNAERYGIDVIAHGVSNDSNNTTRFVVVADRLIAPSEGGKVSIVFSTANSSGTLANVLNIISSYGMSLSKIESRPVAHDKWEYIFYADIEGNIRDRDMQALLFELDSELPMLKVLGSYDGE